MAGFQESNDTTNKIQKKGPKISNYINNQVKVLGITKLIPEEFNKITKKFNPGQNSDTMHLSR